MKILSILVSLCLNWVAFDMNLFRRRAGRLHTPSAELTLAEDGQHAKRRIARKRSNVIPPWLRGARAVVRMKVNHFSPKSKDPRDSDQQKIRRKFNNM